MMQPQVQTLSVEDYLERELSAEERSEYLGGYLHAMSGASLRHSLILGNIHVLLHPLARTKGCRIHQENVKLRSSDDVIYYPDIMVVCGHDPVHTHYEVAPCILVEVLSPNTRGTDLREKLLAYRMIPSLKTYLIVEQEAQLVRVISRDVLGGWNQEDIAGSGPIELPCLGSTLEVADIYRGVF